MNDKNNMAAESESTRCPSQQMSFADIARYLQGGYDEPVQKALAQHIRFCNACQEMVERVSALRRTGHYDMITHVATSGESPVLGETSVAAFIDRRLPDAEEDAIRQSVSGSYAAYVQYAATARELDTPTGSKYVTPRHVMEAMMAPEYQREAVRTSVNRWLDRVAEAFSSFLALRWPAPATAFALGMLLMLAVLPSGETMVALPGFTDEIGLYDDSHIRSGVEEPVEPAAVAIPVQRSRRISFSWQPASFPEPITYRVDLADASGDRVGESIETDDSRVRIDARNLASGERYSISVMARLPNGGMMPVSNQTFTIVEE